MSVYEYISVLTELCQKHEEMTANEYKAFMIMHFGFYEYDKRPLKECVEKINALYSKGLFDKNLSERPLFIDV